MSSMDNMQTKAYLDNDSIRREGVAIVELKGAQGYHGPITSPHYIISLCDSGYIDMEYDSVLERFTPHDLALSAAYVHRPPSHARLPHHVDCRVGRSLCQDESP